MIVVLRGEHQLLKVLLANALQTHSFTGQYFFAEPELTVLVLQSREEGIESLNNDQIFNTRTSRVTPAAPGAVGQENGDQDNEYVAHDWSRRRYLGEELTKLVLLQGVKELTGYGWHHISEHLLVRENPSCAKTIQDWSVA